MDKVDKLHGLLESSINDCVSSSDGPVALQISGGLDSAVIQAIAKVDRLYCCTFPDDGIDNYSMAALAASGVSVAPVTFTKQDMLDVLPVVASKTDGKGSWSQVCQYFMNKQAAADGAKTILTGEGADELFWGYSRYRVLHHFENAWQDEKLGAYTKFIKLLSGDKRQAVFKLMCEYTSETIATDITSEIADADNMVEWAARIDFDIFLPNLMRFGAQMAEVNGLGCEFPFIDDNIIDFAQGLYPEDKLNDHENKHILRELARKLGIASEIIDETTKKGLFIPPTWAPEDTPDKWNTGWFKKLMKEAHG